MSRLKETIRISTDFFAATGEQTPHDHGALPYIDGMDIQNNVARGMFRGVCLPG